MYSGDPRWDPVFSSLAVRGSLISTRPHRQTDKRRNPLHCCHYSFPTHEVHMTHLIHCTLDLPLGHDHQFFPAHRRTVSSLVHRRKHYEITLQFRQDSVNQIQPPAQTVIKMGEELLLSSDYSEGVTNIRS
jgi:hypothetical protein